jgi:HK97 family phage major capsid protein
MPTTTDTTKSAEMQKLHELQKYRAKLIDRAREIETTASADNDRDLTEEETREFDDCIQEADAVELEYHARIKDAQRQARRAALEDQDSRMGQSPSPRSVLDTPTFQRVTHMRDRVLDDPQRGFAHLGEQAMAVMMATMNPGVGVDERLLKIQAAAVGMNQNQPSQGGYAVAPTFSTQIWDGLNTMPDNLMELCDQYPVLGESLTFPANAETSRATGSRYGGVRAYWINEGDQITTSAPKLRDLKLEPQELAALVPITNKLLGNAPALEAYLRRAATEEIMFLVNNAIISGTGAGQPKGVLNSGCLITVAAESGQGADTLEVENINNMYRRLHMRARPGALWLYNQEIEAELDELALLIGTSGVSVMVPGMNGVQNLGEAPIRRLKGLPMRPIEYCSALGDFGDILLANLGFYALGTKGGIDEAMSIHMYFDTAQTAFRFMFAVDGQTWHQLAITPFKGTSTLSPFVTLAAR